MTKTAIKTALTNLILVLLPYTLLAQVVADTSFLFEEAKDDFHEFRWQKDLEISHDSTFYYLKSADILDRLELIDYCHKVIWKPWLQSKNNGNLEIAQFEGVMSY